MPTILWAVRPEEIAMPRFRSPDPTLAGVPLTRDSVRALLADVLDMRHFWTGPSLQLEAGHQPAEECSWDVFQGRLLDPAHTRHRATFESWNLFAIQEGIRSPEPLLSLKLDWAASKVHVVRGLDCYVWEGYDSGGNVFLSRERRKWVRELVGTVSLDAISDLDRLRDELICLLFHGVVGISRLPLASVETPLPTFSFGELFYCFRPVDRAFCPQLKMGALLFDAPFDLMSRREQARWLETVLRVIPLENPAVDVLFWEWSSHFPTGAELLALLQTAYNEVSLSPYHDLGKRTLIFLVGAEQRGLIDAEQRLDFCGWLLRQIVRHLTAYDLVTFHYRGANYPDALLLDDVVKHVLQTADERPELLTDAVEDSPEVRKRKRLRRRGVRQGWIVRRQYEGLLVPDQPTSPGENNRVLPVGEPRVPEEQILQPSHRTRKLYDGDPLPAHLGPRGQTLLRQAVCDLDHPDELRELGLALYLDRPLGDAKAPAEPDRTPLLSSLGFSRTIAVGRLNALKREPFLQSEADLLDRCLARLLGGEVPAGLPVERIGSPRRPATVSLTDARRVAADFVFLHTTPGSLTELLEGLPGFSSSPLLVARSPIWETVYVYDETLRPRWELRVDASKGYVMQANREWPVAGVLIRKVGQKESEADRLTW